MNIVSQSQARRRAGSPRAFTLAELLVVIGIISIVLSVLIVTLAGARGTAGQIKSLANLRDIGLTIDGYLQSNKGVYPAVKPHIRYVMSPNGASGIKTTDENNTRLFFVFAAGNWPGIVAALVGWPTSLEVWLSPSVNLEERGDPSTFFNTSYRYSNSFVARPVVWRAGVSPAKNDVKPVSQHMVLNPSRKAMFWDNEIAYLPEPPPRVGSMPQIPIPILFADLHADVHNPADATPGFPNLLNDDDDTPLHNTPGGVGGFDY